MPKRLAKRKERMRSKSAKVVNPGVFVLDNEDRQLVIFTNDMLINQLRRDGPKIETSFDRLCGQDLSELSAFLAKTIGLLYSGLKASTRHNMKLEGAGAQLLLNATQSFSAATSLLRMGYVLQPGIIVRSILEAVSTVLHLLQKPRDLSAYESHSLQSPKTLAAAKNALPPFGWLYGYFSDNFAHIGRLHKSITPLAEFTERHPALEVNLGFLRVSAWLLYVTTELLFNALVEQPRYWHPVENGYAYDPSPAEREWMGNFFRFADET